MLIELSKLEDSSQAYVCVLTSQLAVQVAEFGRVAVVTKAQADEGCTTWAQGGVCAVLDPLDSIEKHVQDTMVAGAHLNNPA